jgi:hypothetical protein
MRAWPRRCRARSLRRLGPTEWPERDRVHVRLAQLNVAVMREPLESERMSTFVEQLAEVNAAAESADGFVWRLKDEDGPGATSFRMFDDDMMIVNLSVWEGLESLRAFVVGHQGHREALQARRTWFERAIQPMTVCWFVPDDHLPTLAEAESALVRLRTEGPSDELFPFTYRD